MTCHTLAAVNVVVVVSGASVDFGASDVFGGFVGAVVIGAVMSCNGVEGPRLDTVHRTKAKREFSGAMLMALGCVRSDGDSRTAAETGLQARPTDALFAGAHSDTG